MKQNMTEQEFVGFFEADGSICTQVRLQQAKFKGFKMSLKLTFQLTQAKSNIDVLEQVEQLVGGGTITPIKPDLETKEQVGGRLDIQVNKAEGKRVMDIFNKYPLRLARVARDLAILKAIIEVRGVNRILTKEQKAIILLLCYQNSSQIAVRSKVIKKIPIVKRIKDLELSKSIVKDAWAKIKQVYLPRILFAEANVVTNKAMSDEYLRGFFMGDGETSVCYHLTSRNVTAVFCFGITDPSKELLQEMQVKLGCGKISKNNSAFKLRIFDKGDIATKVFPLFSNERYLPEGKQSAFTAFKAAHELSFKEEFRTPSGWKKFVELTYGMTLKGQKRQRSIEEIIAYGENFFLKKKKGLND